MSSRLAKLLGLLLLIEVALGQAQARKPTIVILLADDLGYGELGCQVNPEIPTPHIDYIAAIGVRFTDGYVTGPYWPSCEKKNFSRIP